MKEAKTRGNINRTVSDSKPSQPPPAPEIQEDIIIDLEGGEIIGDWPHTTPQVLGYCKQILTENPKVKPLLYLWLSQHANQFMNRT